jgi:hypothetical protein
VETNSMASRITTFSAYCCTHPLACTKQESSPVNTITVLTINICVNKMKRILFIQPTHAHQLKHFHYLHSDHVR